MNSNVASRFSNFVLNKYGNTTYKLILMSFVFGALMIFVIPQQFCRVIILASIYDQFLKGKKISGDTKEVLFYSVFIGSISTCMFFLNGDILLNCSALQFADVSMNWVEWAKYMTVPTLFTSMLVGASFILTFGGRLKDVDLDGDSYDIVLGNIEFKERAAVIIMGIVLILWMTESLHLINPAFVALLGTIAMFGFKIIGFEDLRSLNIDLMIFLTAAFAIGGVMNKSGVADIIYTNIVGLFPPTYSGFYLVTLILTVMVLHMLLGSSITTFSVVIPILMELTEGILDVIPLMFLVYITVNMHHILPFHHITIMIGAGNNYFSNRVTIKYGAVLTVLVFIIIFGFYLPWWGVLGLI